MAAKNWTSEWAVSHPVLLINYEIRVAIASVVSFLLLAGVYLKVRMFQYLKKEGLKRPVNALIFVYQAVNSGECGLCARRHFVSDMVPFQCVY